MILRQGRGEMGAVGRMTRERKGVENPTRSKERRPANGQTTKMLVDGFIPYQNQRMILIHQIIPKTLNRKSNLPTRHKVVKPIESSWETVPDQAMKKSNGPLSVRLSMKSLERSMALVILPESWKTTKEGNKGDGRDDQHSYYNTLQRTHDSV